MKPTILLVDDNQEMLDILSMQLAGKYDIITATDGKIALGHIADELIHLVVSDVMMPVMDGFALCNTIKSNFEYSHVPVILLTAKTTLQSRIEGLKLGADAYIEKPYDIEHLIVQMDNLIANRQKLQVYFAQSPLFQLKNIASTEPDELFLDKLNKTIQANLEDQDFDIEKLTRLMHLGRTNLFQKIKSLTDLTPNELINLTRLKKAAVLLAAGDYKMYEVAEMVGYASQTNFGKNFLKQFNMTPTEYQRSMHNHNLP